MDSERFTRFFSELFFVKQGLDGSVLWGTYILVVERLDENTFQMYLLQACCLLVCMKYYTAFCEAIQYQVDLYVCAFITFWVYAIYCVCIKFVMQT